MIGWKDSHEMWKARMYRMHVRILRTRLTIGAELRLNISESCVFMMTWLQKKNHGSHWPISFQQGFDLRLKSGHETGKAGHYKDPLVTDAVSLQLATGGRYLCLVL